MALGLRRGYVLLTRGKKVLLVRNRRGRWGLPGGKAKRGEPLRQAAIRETREETGLKVKTGPKLVNKHVRHHRLPCLACVVYRGSFKKGDPRPKSEIVEIRWVKRKEAAELLKTYRAKRVRRALKAALD